MGSQVIAVGLVFWIGSFNRKIGKPGVWNILLIILTTALIKKKIINFNTIKGKIQDVGGKIYKYDYYIFNYILNNSFWIINPWISWRE